MYHPGNLCIVMDESVNIEISSGHENEENVHVSNKQNVTCTQQNKSDVSLQYGSDVTPENHKNTLENIRNLPGHHHTLVGMNADQVMDPPKAKRLKLSPSNGSVNSLDMNDVTETGKRRRIQHDYRRLSSSGYLDDYETSRERRFSSDSASDAASPSPNKSKVTTPPAVSKEADNPALPHVKLTLKLSKTENGTFVNGSGKIKNHSNKKLFL